MPCKYDTMDEENHLFWCTKSETAGVGYGWCGPEMPCYEEADDVKMMAMYAIDPSGFYLGRDGKIYPRFKKNENKQ